MLMGLFIDTPATVAYGASFLRIMVLAMPMMAVCYPMITQFQAMGRVKESLICSVLRKGVLDIPLLFLLNGLLPMYGCTMVQPIVDYVSMLAALWLYRRILRQEGRVRQNGMRQQKGKDNYRMAAPGICFTRKPVVCICRPLRIDYLLVGKCHKICAIVLILGRCILIIGL